MADVYRFKVRLRELEDYFAENRNRNNSQSWR